MRHCRHMQTLLPSAVQVSEGLNGDVAQLLHRELHTSGKTFAASGDITLDLEHATGLERSVVSCYRSSWATSPQDGFCCCRQAVWAEAEELAVMCRTELEGKLQGKDIFHEDWYAARPVCMRGVVA